MTVQFPTTLIASYINSTVAVGVRALDNDWFAEMKTERSKRRVIPCHVILP